MKNRKMHSKLLIIDIENILQLDKKLKQKNVFKIFCSNLIKIQFFFVHLLERF